MITIIDYGVGNHQSVSNALTFLKYDFTISSDADEITKGDALILPGVGAFHEAMKNLEQRGLIDVLNEQVLQKNKPILGICLGMQLLAESSEEDGHHKGLGWIPGHIRPLKEKAGLRIPHVGWNNLHIASEKPLFLKTTSTTDFYFDHSYQFEGGDKYISSTCSYGYDITASIQKDHIFGVQFHPEKSRNAGLKLFRSFFDSLGVAHA